MFHPWVSLKGVVADQGYGSYAYNDNGCGGQGLAGCFQDGVWSPTRTSQVASPSDMFAISDALLMTGVTPVSGWPTTDICYKNPNPIPCNYYAKIALAGEPAGDPGVLAERQRHGGRWNMGFCDAHTESLRVKQIFDLTNAAVNQRWNIDDQPHTR
ncbi:MAG: hypothetical protein ACLQVX_01830 [Limisphaerales bacterium]